MTLSLYAPDAHRDRHRWLHRALDELVNDYIFHHPKAINVIETLTVEQLLFWAAQQAERPTEPVGDQHRDANPA
jgi:hypothetical protein